MQFFFQKILVFCGKLRGLMYNLIPGVSIGRGTVIERGATIRPYCRWGWGGQVKIGRNCYIGKGCEICSASSSIIIGNETTINPYSFVYGIADIRIGSQVRIGAHCVIVAVNHIYSDIETPICKQGVTAKGISVEDNVWLGASVTVIDGVVIKNGNIIGAGSVVTKSTDINCVYVGVPAYKMKNR